VDQLAFMNSRIGCLGCLVGLFVGFVVAAIAGGLILREFVHFFGVSLPIYVWGGIQIIIVIAFGILFSKIFSYKR